MRQFGSAIWKNFVYQVCSDEETDSKSSSETISFSLVAKTEDLPLWRQPSDLSKKPQPLESLDLTYTIKLAYSVTGDGNSKDYRFVGVIEANSIEPAHDKHDFERSGFVFEARDETKTDAKGLLETSTEGHCKPKMQRLIKSFLSGHVFNPRPDLSVSQTGSRDRTVFNNDRPIVQDPPGFDTVVRDFYLISLTLHAFY
ncbi:microrchidia 2-like protein [Tanacetum coccineum]|uniref:Microrchidia 2-like protein n=1 Tax=Tanacetum coccineum TaxID=301880 RepID=A0ABQ4WCN2_9ASTR